MSDESVTFGALELDIMSILWEKTVPISVGDVQNELSTDRDLAYTTVMTVLSNLYKKGAVDRAKQGKAYVYWAKHKRDQAAAGLFDNLLKKIYRDNPAAMLAGFLKTSQPLTSDDIRDLHRELDKLEQELD